MSYSIQCVHCQAVLKSPTPVPPGKRVKCPKCKETFTTPRDQYEKTAEVPIDDEVPPEEGTPHTKIEKTTALAKPPQTAADDDTEVTTAIGKAEPDRPAAKKKPLTEAPREEIHEVDGDLDEEEFDAAEENRARKKRRDDEDEEDERPRNRKNQHEEDEDDEPRGKARKKQKSGRGMLWILLGGGGVLILGCCVCGVAGFFLSGLGGPSVIGKWENQEVKAVFGKRMIFEFRADGTGTIDMAGPIIHFTYTQNGSEIILNQTHIEGGGKKQPDNTRKRIDVSRTGNTLAITFHDRFDARLGAITGTYRKID